MVQKEGSRSSYSELLKNGYLDLYSTTEFLTRFGMGLTSIGLILLAFGEMGSILNVSYVRLAGYIPILFLGLAAGAYVDRIGKKRSYIISALASSLVVLIPIFYRDLSVLVLVVGFKAILAKLKGSAHSGILPSIVKKRELMKANSLLRAVNNGAAVIAPTAGVFIIYGYGYFYLFLIDSFTYLLDAVAMYFIPVEEEKSEGKRGILGVFKEIKDAFGHIKERKDVVFLIGSGFVISVFAVGYGLYVLKFIDKIFQTRMFYGFYRSAAAVGGVSGGLFMGKYLDDLSFKDLISLSSILLGVAFLGVPLVPINSSFIVFPFIFSFGISVMGVSVNTGIQSLCEQKFLGRVSSFYTVSSISGSLIAVPTALIFIYTLGIVKGMLLVGMLFLLFGTLIYAKSNAS